MMMWMWPWRRISLDEPMIRPDMGRKIRSVPRENK